ncbi:MAG: tRNA (guanine(26)-N(2))-dimethyltransferase [Nanoarchaeota archaeon]|nr:tRNA (guanine(26)-N(2))-dimethyltransferase [Nanoarchaeota archaeon]
MAEQYREGKARFYASECTNLSAKLPVFYNPVMKLNRDVAVWVVKTLITKDVNNVPHEDVTSFGYTCSDSSKPNACRYKPKSICLGMEASGVRAVRMALEADAENIIANDASKDAFEAMQKNIELNNITNAVKASNKDVKQLLAEGNLYDYIDIDPFGTPVYYAESAINALSKNGVLAVTATDTSCLCGRFVNACIKKYSSRPLNNGFNKETGVRILVWKMQEIALKQGKVLLPIFAHSSNHYMRAYLKQVPLKEEDIKTKQGYILYCHKCLNRYVSQVMEGECCNTKMAYAGPLWLGSLWDKELLDEFSLIPHIREESLIDVPWHYDVHKVAKAYKKEAVKMDYLINALQKNGFKASRTHFKPEGVRTDADINSIASLL